MILSLLAAALTGFVLAIVIWPVSVSARALPLYGGAALIALLAGGLYIMRGQPFLPDSPLSLRIAGAPENLPPLALAARIETHLAARPDDSEGWRLLGPLYIALGRYDEALYALARARDIAGDDASLLIASGEAMVGKAGGMVPEEARRVFEHALQLDAHSIPARYFLALAAEQEGDIPAARALFIALLADLPVSSPLRAELEAQLAELPE